MDGMHPWAEQHQSDPTTLRAATLTTTTYVPSSVLDVARWREVTLLLDIDSGDTSGQVHLIPALAGSVQPPATTADEWFVPSTYDGSVVVLDPPGSKYASAAWTLQPEWGQLVLRPTFISSESGGLEAATDEIRMAVTIKCGWARHFHVQVAGSGSGTLPTLSILAVRSL